MENDAIAVLLVEDNPADVAILTELLQDSDASSWQTTNFKRLNLALRHFSKLVVLLDTWQSKLH